nr:MAG TPA: hypothetical protein [Caudoviricetes sp.]
MICPVNARFKRFYAVLSHFQTRSDLPLQLPEHKLQPRYLLGSQVLLRVTCLLLSRSGAILYLLVKPSS